MGKFVNREGDQIGTSQEQAEAHHAKDVDGRTYEPAQDPQKEVPSVVACSVDKAIELDKRLRDLVVEAESARRDLNRLFGTGAPPVSLAPLSSRQ